MVRAAIVALGMTMLLGGCRMECEAGDGASKDKPAASTAAAPAAQAPSQPAAKPAAPAVASAPVGLKICGKLADNRMCGANETQFATTVPEVHAILVTKTVPRQDGKATMVWIAEDTGGKAPPNFKIATKVVDLAGDALKTATQVTVSGSLTRPNNGWPQGQYRVDFVINGKVDASGKFKIQ